MAATCAYLLVTLPRCCPANSPPVLLLPITLDDVAESTQCCSAPMAAKSISYPLLLLPTNGQCCCDNHTMMLIAPTGIAADTCCFT
jgi:hypothetical protein